MVARGAYSAALAERGPSAGQFSAQAFAELDRFPGAFRPIHLLLSSRRMRHRPRRGADLIGGSVQSQVPLRFGRAEHLHLVQMQIGLAGDQKAHIPAGLARQLNHERFAIGDALEERAIVLINLAEMLAIRRKQELDSPGTVGSGRAVPDHDAGNGLGLAKINLPPRVLRFAGMEAHLAILNTVATADGVGLGCHRRGDRVQQGHLLGKDPVRFNSREPRIRRLGMHHRGQSR